MYKQHKPITKEGSLKFIPESDLNNRYGGQDSEWQSSRVKLLPNAILEVYLDTGVNIIIQQIKRRLFV